MSDFSVNPNIKVQYKGRNIHEEFAEKLKDGKIDSKELQDIFKNPVDGRLFLAAVVRDTKPEDSEKVAIAITETTMHTDVKTCLGVRGFIGDLVSPDKESLGEKLGNDLKHRFPRKDLFVVEKVAIAAELSEAVSAQDTIDPEAALALKKAGLNNSNLKSGTMSEVTEKLELAAHVLSDEGYSPAQIIRFVNAKASAFDAEPENKRTRETEELPTVRQNLLLEIQGRTNVMEHLQEQAKELLPEAFRKVTEYRERMK